MQLLSFLKEEWQKPLSSKLSLICAVVGVIFVFSFFLFWAFTSPNSFFAVFGLGLVFISFVAMMRKIVSYFEWKEEKKPKNSDRYF